MDLLLRLEVYFDKKHAQCMTFSYTILFWPFSQNYIFDHSCQRKNYFGKTIQDRELQFSPIVLWDVLGAISNFGCHSFILKVCKQR